MYVSRQECLLHPFKVEADALRSRDQGRFLATKRPGRFAVRIAPFWAISLSAIFLNSRNSRLLRRLNDSK